MHFSNATDRFASNGVSVSAKGPIGMGFQPYQTHARSTLEAQPLVDTLGNMLVLDGRIDNHKELCEVLNICNDDSPDSLIVLAAFQQWGEQCFSRLIGDWSLAIWSNNERALYLARDHAGTRTLYFEHREGAVLWSTYLETFFTQRATRELDGNYAACYLACQPLRDLTPYKGIKAVSPAHYVKLTADGTITHRKHWEWAVTDVIRYRDDREYDQHFLSLFRQSVERRTGPGAPILAQLSGGMDSSSIVCVSDEQRIALGASPADLIDTISFYDDSEPDWNERPYFSRVETKRGKAGIHVANSFVEGALEPPVCEHGGYVLPGRDHSIVQREAAIDRLIREQGYRVILSGIGGDEVLGGVPTPLPELADLLVAGNISSFFSRSIAWCLPSRMPLLQMMSRTVEHLLQLYLWPQRSKRPFPPWIQPNLRRLCSEVRRQDVARLTTRFHCRPCAIDNGLAWWAIMETVPHNNPSSLSRYEYRYPYLDRDLVNFLYRIPRAQLLQPGRRRFLMRRALKGIVPEEILERRRKAYLSRNLVRLFDSAHGRLAALVSESPFFKDGSLERRQIDDALKSVLQKREGECAHALLNAAFFALWLKSTTSLTRTIENVGFGAQHSSFALKGNKLHPD
jgi:asparagine synthase (glutamine-hydrolysing)